MQNTLPKSKWDYLFYLCLITLTIWLVLKVTGVINTLVWLEYGVPMGTLILGFYTFYETLIDKFFIMISKISKLEANDARMEVRLDHIERDVELVKSDVKSFKGDVEFLKAGK